MQKKRVKKILTKNCFDTFSNTNNDEMCNFYMMYWVDGEHIMKNGYCFSQGPPEWDWSKFTGLNFKDAPINASMVPGEKTYSYTLKKKAFLFLLKHVPFRPI